MRADRGIFVRRFVLIQNPPVPGVGVAEEIAAGCARVLDGTLARYGYRAVFGGVYRPLQSVAELDLRCGSNAREVDAATVVKFVVANLIFLVAAGFGKVVVEIFLRVAVVAALICVLEALGGNFSRAVTPNAHFFEDVGHRVHLFGSLLFGSEGCGAVVVFKEFVGVHFVLVKPQCVESCPSDTPRLSGDAVGDFAPSCVRAIRHDSVNKRCVGIVCRIFADILGFEVN